MNRIIQALIIGYSIGFIFGLAAYTVMAVITK